MEVCIRRGGLLTDRNHSSLGLKQLLVNFSLLFLECDQHVLIFFRGVERLLTAHALLQFVGHHGVVVLGRESMNILLLDVCFVGVVWSQHTDLGKKKQAHRLQHCLWQLLLQGCSR